MAVAVDMGKIAALPVAKAVSASASFHPHGLGVDDMVLGEDPEVVGDGLLDLRGVELGRS